MDLITIITCIISPSLGHRSMLMAGSLSDGNQQAWQSLWTFCGRMKLASRARAALGLSEAEN
jgi:hypothetical protein